MSHPRNEALPVRQRDDCIINGCDRLEERAGLGLCAGHRYRKKHGLPLEGPFHEGLARRLTPKQALLEAAIDLGDVDALDEVAYRRAVERLCYAARKYGEARGR